METLAQERLVKALSFSGRRLVRRASGWAVLAGADLRGRSLVACEDEAARRLVEVGVVRPAASGPGYVLSQPGEVETAPQAGVMAMAAAGAPRSRTPGGFVDLVRRAGEGDGPLSARAAAAGLRLVTDAEDSQRDPRLSMSFSGMPHQRGRRGGGAGGSPARSLGAAMRLQRLAETLGKETFATCWRACVEGLSLVQLARREGATPRFAGALLAGALSRLADAYERV